MGFRTQTWKFDLGCSLGDLKLTFVRLDSKNAGKTSILTPESGVIPSPTPRNENGSPY